ncbi:uracil-DNA glycosylase [Candidatus Peregrinibacteria bacterium CG22_combo_CG10-13_8_21_14_all_44_10]|nr:MAG: uracil-DNA glycosylase [Candidatus Peregrinibacteria bacterium CG2_30_44_17]PIP66148.1 MAG: uracil-DNA glycosylase [Candidatus Peregrinibacteria bacterium CG22_combo_CG10-13_8_21_14_all_44_10]PIS04214.1 MAG: uracil-DNA glycosylase [Candidatus Peregrinibacteria bacterium CG10_big_fil_rev_8_21_14_0_10_44_7]PIX79793.1 MAG: uracil-DNA glycosylase [Candidatus Peregrinibacteria bacterium CG_4_10_14_3_um_filter_44_21]PJB88331.1 MAG: uracil-DNA glycosylase [Candidatus Peregrinibacteria bacteriu
MTTTLRDIEDQCKKCTKCPLHEGRTNGVPGEGNPHAEIMFIGEGPGKDEDLQGRPFVGAAGKFLDHLLSTVDLKREDVYIANVVKCRPPNNRDPLPEEIAACWPYLEAQIRAIKPILIVTLGRHSMGRFLPGLKISEAHGKAKRYKGIDGGKQVYYPMYHPAVALYNGSYREILIEDMKNIPVLLQKIKKENLNER